MGGLWPERIVRQRMVTFTSETQRGKKRLGMTECRLL